jgi:predicted esterase
VIRRGPGSGAAKGVVALHGRGGSGADILSVLDAAGLPGIAGIAPEAPGTSWWPTSFLAPSAQMEPFVTRAVAVATAAVAALESEGIPRSGIWLAGLSQGAGLALETFARAGEGLAGVLAFSGGLVGTADAPGEPDPALYGQRPKRFDYPGRRDGAQVWLSVHDRDPHIPPRRVQETAEVLAALGATVETHIVAGAGHGLFPEDLDSLRRYLG